MQGTTRYKSPNCDIFRNRSRVFLFIWNMLPFIFQSHSYNAESPMKQAKRTTRARICTGAEWEGQVQNSLALFKQAVSFTFTRKSCSLCLRLKINKVYSECPYQLSYIYLYLVLIQIMRAKWANINKDHTTEKRALSLSPSLPLSNLCIVLLTCFWHIRQNYKLSSDVCEKGIFTGRACASAPARAQSTQRFAFQLSHTSAIKALILNV